MNPGASTRARAFRLIPYGEYDAVTNMAVDEALLDLHLAGNTPPTLRFYGWTPPAVSFGYGQRVSAATIERIKKAGYDVVRRPTGGRAVLHEGELTYCFIASSRVDPGDLLDSNGQNSGQASDETMAGSPAESPFEPILDKSVARAYRQICDALARGLAALGAEASLGKGEGGSYKNYDDCFQATTQADLQYQGKKIVGSAQLRRRHGVLQHGSIMLNQPQDQMAELLGLESNQAEENGQQRHFNLRDILADEVDRTAIEEAIGMGFTRAFDCRFAVYDIKDEEWDAVKALIADGDRYKVGILENV